MINSPPGLSGINQFRYMLNVRDYVHYKFDNGWKLQTGEEINFELSNYRDPDTTEIPT